MQRIVLRFGLISGIVLCAVTAVLMPLSMRGVIDFGAGQVIGYSAMVLSFLLVFFGIRSYRDEVAGGSVTFGRAFGVGLLITVVACAFYVVAWEIVYHGFIPDFLDHYSAHVIGQLRAEGATAAAIAAKEAEMARFAELYANPLFNVLITFMEPFPVGLIVTLVSAAILRKKPGARADGPAAATT